MYTYVYSLQQYFTQQGNYILSIQFYVTNCRIIIICRGSPLTEFLESPRPQIYILKKLNLKIIAMYLLKLKSDASKKNYNQRNVVPTIFKLSYSMKY